MGNLASDLTARLSPGAWVRPECKEQKCGPFITFYADPTPRQTAWALLDIRSLPDRVQALIYHLGRWHER